MDGSLFTDGDWIETKDQDRAGEIRLVQLADVGEGVFRNRSSRFVNVQTAKRLNCTFLEPGDVLVARMPEPLGRACLVPQLGMPAITAVDVCILRPDSASVHPSWLMWAINSPQVRRQVLALQTGTTRRRVSRKNLGTVQLDVPPLDEQQRIVAAIEEQFSRLDAAEASLERARRGLGQHRHATLLAAASGSWEVRPLGDLLVSLRNGVFVSRPSAEPPGVPIFRISAVRPMSLDVADVRFAPQGTDPDGAYLIEEDDLLFTRYSGNASYVGACARVPHLPRPTLHPDKLIRAVVDRALAEPAYLELVLSVGSSAREIARRRKTTAGQVGIAGSQLKSVPVAVPPLDVQQQTVAALEARRSLWTALSRELVGVGARAGQLRASVLRDAFRGRLISV